MSPKGEAGELKQTATAGVAVPASGAQGLLFTEDLPVLDEDAGYRGPTACKAAGITYRQLDYWARTGLVEPAVRGAAGSGVLCRPPPRFALITLMSDGASVYECTSADEVIDLVQGGQGVFGIAVGRVWREVEGSLAALPSEHAADQSFPDDELSKRRAARKIG